MSCTCDKRAFPELPLQIPPGLASLPRQIGGFADFRADMLARVPTTGPLIPWRARASDDFGLLLIEWWAYVCDVVTFYDQVLANEAFLRTAQLRPSVRRLTGLLGYLPRPAIASAVRLGLLADGKLPVSIPAGTAIRSGAFGSEKPQIFETDAAVTIDPDANRWSIVPPRATTIGGTVSSLLLSASSKVKAGRGILIAFGSGASSRFARVAKAVTPTVEADGVKYLRLDLDHAITLASPRAISTIRILMPSQSVSLWGQPAYSGEPAPVDTGEVPVALPCGKTGAASGHASLVLDGVYRALKPGDPILLSRKGEYRWFTVSDRGEPLLTVTPAVTSDPKVPAVRVPATQLVLDASLNADDHKRSGVGSWASGDASQILVHYGMVDAGTVAAPAATVLQASDDTVLASVHIRPSGPPDPRHFLLASADTRGLEASGHIEFGAGSTTGSFSLLPVVLASTGPLLGAPPGGFTQVGFAQPISGAQGAVQAIGVLLDKAALGPGQRRLALDSGTTWAPALELPVTVHGNIVGATRGESVPAETLGTGDASQASQSFTLKKQPLTWVPSVATTSDWGAVSTLTVWVDGVRWTEVQSFYGAAHDAEVYIVRERDDGASAVTFGDGVLGARLPTGASVVASYRFGAGAACPPADSIKQIARPVKGLKSVVNPVAAAGGADAESPDEIRSLAPRSALLLGRAVSIDDMETAALTVAGVKAASAQWRWAEVQQRPVVHVFYIGAASLAPTVSQRLRALSDPSTPITVEVAQGTPVVLSIDLATDPRRITADVVAAARALLVDEGTGLLRPERLGVDRPVFRSELFRALQSVTGVVAVRAISWNGVPLNTYGRKPSAGHYFDFVSAGKVLLTGGPDNG